MQTLFRILLPVAILAIGWFGFSMLGKEKEGRKRPKPPPRVIKTRVLELQQTNYQTVVRTNGVVRAHNESALTAEVTGKVISVSPRLEDGGMFDEGEVLVDLDKADFETAVIAAEADVARAKSALAQEEARANQARVNWEELGYDEEPGELVLRLPQLREAQANVKASGAALDRAQRNLTRTAIRAPFAGRVLSKSVAVGQTVSPNTPLATVFGTDFVEVRLPIAASNLKYLKLPESTGQKPVDVELMDSLNPELGAVWHGKIVGTEGALDEESRELFAIARVDDPFGLKKPEAERETPLRVGQPVSAAIDGIVMGQVLTVPRSAVRQLNRIFLVVEKDGGQVLEARDIEPLWSDSEFHVIRDEGIPDGSLVATTRLVYAPKESPVEILSELSEGEVAAEPESEPGRNGKRPG